MRQEGILFQKLFIVISTLMRQVFFKVIFGDSGKYEAGCNYKIQIQPQRQVFMREV